MSYSCKILADSISPAGHRITSFEVTFPRIVLAELNTHCMLGRNSASSRAMPVLGYEKNGKYIPGRVDTVRSNPFVPKAFGRNQKGMQPGEALEGDDAYAAHLLWLKGAEFGATVAENLAKIGVHKQYANRLLEPFSWHTAVITATDLDNFFHLRVSPLAQGELRDAAVMMFESREASAPRLLNPGEWHLPYVDRDEELELQASGHTPWKVSVGRCARVSYLTQNGVRDPAEDVAMYDVKLLEPGHMSPLEHVATPMSPLELDITRAFDITINGGPALRVGMQNAPEIGERIKDYGIRFEGRITSVRGPLNYCGKLNGWISRRAYVPGEWDIVGERAKQ